MLEIHKILFPTSFSQNAKNAFLYTIGMAKYFGAKIVVLHVCEPKIDILVPSVMRFKLLQEQKRIAERNLKEWVDEFDKKGVEVSHEVVQGFAKETIAIYANEHEGIDLIAIGSKDTNSFTKMIWGNIISQAVESANMPVLVIPKGIVFQHIKNMAYVTPVGENWREACGEVKQIAKGMNASLYITHLPQAEYNTQEGEKHVVVDDYASALYSFAFNTNIHLLVTSRLVRNTFLRILKYSKAQKMAFKAIIPLLVLKKS